MAKSVLEVFTAKSLEQMFENGGSQSWVLNSRSMEGVEYVVCCRNDDPAYEEECGVRTDPRNAAFMVGRVSGLKKIERRHDRDRYLVEFNEYAPVLVENFRHGSVRNPVTYGTLDSCRLRGLDIERLDFEPMPNRHSVSVEATQTTRSGISIAEAKDGLAIFFGVPTENVQITISG